MRMSNVKCKPVLRQKFAYMYVCMYGWGKGYPPTGEGGKGREEYVGANLHWRVLLTRQTKERRGEVVWGRGCFSAFLIFLLLLLLIFLSEGGLMCVRVCDYGFLCVCFLRLSFQWLWLCFLFFFFCSPARLFLWGILFMLFACALHTSGRL